MLDSTCHFSQNLTVVACIQQVNFYSIYMDVDHEHNLLALFLNRLGSFPVPIKM